MTLHKERATLPVSELEPAPYNPRSIDDRALAGLQTSLSEFGLLQDIVVNKRGDKYRVIGGHQRLRAMEQIGEVEAECIVVEVDDKTERAINLSLNNPAIQGRWTIDLDAMLREQKAENAALYKELRMGELEAEAEAMLKELEEKDDGPQEAPPQLGTGLMYSVIVDFDNEQAQIAIMEELEGRGMKCRLLIT